MIPLVHQVYTAKDTTLNTLEELNAQLARINEEVPEDTIVDIYLPPMTYSGNPTLLRVVNLYGSAEGSGRTIFTSTLSVNSDYPSNVMLFDLDFAGDGGIGFMYTQAETRELHTELHTSWRQAEKRESRSLGSLSENP